MTVETLMNIEDSKIVAAALKDPDFKLTDSQKTTLFMRFTFVKPNWEIQKLIAKGATRYDKTLIKTIQDLVANHANIDAEALIEIILNPAIPLTTKDYQNLFSKKLGYKQVNQIAQLVTHQNPILLGVLKTLNNHDVKEALKKNPFLKQKFFFDPSRLHTAKRMAFSRTLEICR